jgi:hypothetical protein
MKREFIDEDSMLLSKQPFPITHTLAQSQVQLTDTARPSLFV